MRTALNDYLSLTGQDEILAIPETRSDLALKAEYGDYYNPLVGSVPTLLPVIAKLFFIVGGNVSSQVFELCRLTGWEGGKLYGGYFSGPED